MGVGGSHASPRGGNAGRYRIAVRDQDVALAVLIVGMGEVRRREARLQAAVTVFELAEHALSLTHVVVGQPTTTLRRDVRRIQTRRRHSQSRMGDRIKETIVVDGRVQ